MGLLNHFVLPGEFVAILFLFKMFVLFSNDMGLGIHRGWSSCGSIKVTKQTTTGSQTTKIRHEIIFCHVRQVKMRKVKL